MELNLDLANASPILTIDYTAIELWLVGCGGTGSWLAPSIVRLGRVLSSKGKKVKLYFVDPDHVEEANVLRQCFCDAEIGLNKAKTLALRYAIAWKMEVGAIAQSFDSNWVTPGYNTLALVAGCVDNARARQSIAQVLENNNHQIVPHTWYLDCGNSRRSGQVLIGSHLSTKPDDYQFNTLGCFRLPAPTVQHPDLLIPQPEEMEDKILSCEQLALLNSQSLSINQRVAAEAFDYLLQLTTGKLRRFATYFDLESGSGRSLYTTQASVIQAIH
ncbi:MAG: thiamine biosynthesis protein ThiF [Leptolyngbyaceae cyanobacterium RM2_2_4]|nr:thiamine biosynthesis protein ThiF [Leptolyngbyaceae cyanobacterium SM1_4_3]NJO48471.1 thiamine biosynthesis protein ThiF [Leptolyngbyaceae cyanobacterium RM2_2_4]